MNGSIISWNDANGRGLVNGTHLVVRSNCTQRLQDELEGKAIPPDGSVAVTFDEGPAGDAINVDLR